MTLRPTPRLYALLCAGLALTLAPVAGMVAMAAEREGPAVSPPSAPGTAPEATRGLSPPTWPLTRFQKLEREVTSPGQLSAARSVAPDGTVRVSSPKGTREWTASAMSDHGMPAAAERAYRNAARSTASTDPACQLPWTLLAGVGRVESDHGRYGGSTLGRDGVSHPLIIGVQLNGAGPVAAIRDSDGGKLDGDKVWDRAVGPMQFIPTTWADAARDGDGDGVASPNDIDDAALAAAGYLCPGGGSILGETAMGAALLRYNQDDYYVALVMAFERGYRTGSFVMPAPPVVEPAENDQAGRDRDKKRDRDKDRDKDRDEKGDADRDKTRGTGKDRPDPAPKPPPKPKTSPGSSGAGSGWKPPAQGPSTQKPPAPKAPEPKPKPEPKPTPKPPKPTPKPPKAEEPKLVLKSGQLKVCDAGLCLGREALDLGSSGPLAADLAELSGKQVTLLVEETSAGLVVHSIE